MGYVMQKSYFRIVFGTRYTRALAKNKLNMQVDNSDRNKTAGLLFVGCFFVGMAIGFALGKVQVGVFGGLGAGFLASAAYRAMRG